jgi:hypothetical protein
MTEHTAWSGLPNAKYIDLVIASLKKNPASWVAVRDAAWAKARDAVSDAARDMARDAAWDEVWDTVWNAEWDAVSDAARDAARDAAWDAVWSALLALVAWDDCGYLLEEKPEDVKMLALLGNHAAVLLYPACVALQNTKKLEME